MDKFHSRTIGLIGEEGVKILLRKHVAIFGVGGVGGTCLESLCRSGVGHIDIFDFDDVDESNLNRQICYSFPDIGQNKVLIAYKKMKNINPACEVSAFNLHLNEENINSIDFSKYDYVIDCIDETRSKISLIERCMDKNIKIVSSLGMANRFDPSKVFITTLDKTFNDPLAKLLRNRLKKDGYPIKKLFVAFSSELPVKNGTFKGSMMLVPSSSGLNLSYKVLMDLLSFS